MPGTAYPFVVETLKPYLRPDSRVLEIGCGGKQYRPMLPGVYEGLDLPTSPYLEDRPEYACSAESIPCEDERFDLVFGVATFPIIADVVRAFAECRRVLKRRGSLIVFDYQKQVCERLQAADTSHRHVWDFCGMKRRLQAAGFSSGKIRDITGASVYATDRLSWRSVLGRLAAALGRKGPWLVVEATK